MKYSNNRVLAVGKDWKIPFPMFTLEWVTKAEPHPQEPLRAPWGMCQGWHRAQSGSGTPKKRDGDGWEQWLMQPCQPSCPWLPPLGWAPQSGFFPLSVVMAALGFFPIVSGDGCFWKGRNKKWQFEKKWEKKTNGKGAEWDAARGFGAVRRSRECCGRCLLKPCSPATHFSSVKSPNMSENFLQ